MKTSDSKAKLRRNPGVGSSALVRPFNSHLWNQIDEYKRLLWRGEKIPDFRMFQREYNARARNETCPQTASENEVAQCQPAAPTPQPRYKWPAAWLSLPYQPSIWQHRGLVSFLRWL